MLRPSVWSRPFQIPEWADADTLVDQKEAAKLLGVDRRTLQRADCRGEGPPKATEFVGPQHWYRVMELLLWRHAVTGSAPGSPEEIEALCGQRISSRTQPATRASWWRRGERRYLGKRRILAKITRRLAWLELAVALAPQETSAARVGFEDALTRLRKT